MKNLLFLVLVSAIFLGCGVVDKAKELTMNSYEQVKKSISEATKSSANTPTDKKVAKVIHKKILKKKIVKTDSEKLYANLIYYQGMQSKEKISLINKEPIYTKNFKSIKISKDSKKVIINNKIYAINPFKLIYEAKQSNIKILDFYNNNYFFMMTDKGYGLYSFIDKKFKYKFAHHGKFKSASYSNGILRYIFENKKGNVNNYRNYYNVNLDNIARINLKYPYENIYSSSSIIVNDAKTYAIIFYKKSYSASFGDESSKVRMLNLKTGKDKEVSSLRDKCKEESIKFLSNDAFACGKYMLKIPSLEMINTNSQYILNKDKYLIYDYSKVYIKNIKDNKTLDEVKFQDYMFYDHSVISKNKKIIVAQTKDNHNLYNIYNTSNFLGTKNDKLVNNVLLEVDKSKVSLEKAFTKVFSEQPIKLNSSDFIQNENTLEVYINGFGAFAFTANSSPEKLSKQYKLKNAKFKIENNDIKLISADLYPTDSGEIFSMDRVPPAYKYSNKSSRDLYKFNKKEQKLFNKIKKMIKAELYEEAGTLMEALSLKNPIGVYWARDKLGSIPWVMSGKIWINSINVFSKTKKAFIGVESIDTKDIGRYGALITKFTKKSPARDAGLKVGDIIVSIDDNEIKRNSDITEVMFYLENGSIEVGVIRDRKKFTFIVIPIQVVKSPNSIRYSYFAYMRNAMKAGHYELVKIASDRLQNDIDAGFFSLNRYYKERLLFYKANYLSAIGKYQEAFKLLLNYDDEFLKRTEDNVLGKDNLWVPLWRYPKKLSVVFDVGKNKIPKETKLFKHDYVDLDGNILKATNSKIKIKKKLEYKSQSGGVLE